MDLKEVRRNNKHLVNQLERLLEQKELLFIKTQPKAVKFDTEQIKGGIIENKNENYLILLEELEKDICKLKCEIEINERYIENELKVIDEFDPLVSEIIKLKLKGNSFKTIGLKVGYSEGHCRRLFRINYGIYR